MQTLLCPAAPHARFSQSLPISIPLSIPLSTPSSNACHQIISNTESGGESLARPMSRSMDAVSIMGEWDDNGEAGTGGWGPLFTAVAGRGSRAALERDGGCGCCGCGIFTVLRLFADVGMFA